LRQRLIPKTVLAGFAELIIAEEEIEPDRLVAKLVAGGYTRSVVVEEPGDFCVRGGIIDIFSPLYDNPLRIELFGDFAETIRFFSPASQRSLDHVHEAVILPAREVTLEEGSTGCHRRPVQGTGAGTGSAAHHGPGYRDSASRSRGSFPASKASPR
jgi:transcription-repair coupling factor (superfamily II helicase)